MDTPAFQYLLSLFPLFTLRQRRVAQQELTAPHAITSLNTQLPACSGCPHCQADPAQLAPWGWSRGLRRYRCKLCLRTSTVLTKTPLAWLRKAQCWEDYAQALIEGLTVRQAALRRQQKYRLPLASPLLARDGNSSSHTGRGHR